MSKKLDRIKQLVESKRTLCFLATTPGSKTNSFRTVLLKHPELKSNRAGNVLICGRDVMREHERDREMGVRIPHQSHRRKEDKVYRSFRLDRIITRSLTAV